MHSQLETVGEKKERQGKIRVIADESYARIALNYLLAQYLPGQSLDKRQFGSFAGIFLSH